MREVWSGGRLCLGPVHYRQPSSFACTTQEKKDHPRDRDDNGDKKDVPLKRGDAGQADKYYKCECGEKVEFPKPNANNKNISMQNHRRSQPHLNNMKVCVVCN